MNVIDFLNKYNVIDTFEGIYVSHAQRIRPYALCKDGYKISIQASETHYCSPRENGLHYYKYVELGFPNKSDELINEYAEDCEDYKNTVYGYVPIQVVEELIAKHGGIIGARTKGYHGWETGLEDADGYVYF